MSFPPESTDRSDPSRWSVRDQAAAIRARTLSSGDLLDLQLAHIGDLDAELGAVVTLDAENARRQAAIADDEARMGRWRGPLHGLPITVKDALSTAGLRSTGGASALARHVPDADAVAVARIRRAGAIVIGKTNVPAWSADIQTVNELFGVTRNPWDPARTSGGSSGGAAVAVATGMTSFEIGTDIGGSLRIPAHCCGVFAHKPSFGLVPQDGYLGHRDAADRPAPAAHVWPQADMNVVGPMARTAGDLALLLDLIVGPSKATSTAWTLGLPGPRHWSLDEYRVGLWLDDPACEIDHEMRELLEGAAARLQQAHAHTETTPPPVELAETVATFRGLVDGALNRDDGRQSGRPSLSHAAWLSLDERRAEQRSAWYEWFRSHDVFLCPVVPTVAFPHDHSGTLRDRTLEVNGRRIPHTDFSSWVGIASATYLPSTVVPVGWTSAGMPVGIQIVGPYLEDHTTLFVAEQLARLLR